MTIGGCVGIGVFFLIYPDFYLQLFDKDIYPFYLGERSVCVNVPIICIHQNEYDVLRLDHKAY